jgi:hypothetical protein
MRLADVLDTCCVPTVTVSAEVSLAQAVQTMFRDHAAAICIEGRPRDILTAEAILRVLTRTTSPALAWSDPVAGALGEGLMILTKEEPVRRVIEKMLAAGIDHMPVAVSITGTAVVSLCRLLLVESAFLHGEVQHLQTYIDALHDAPND